MVRRIAANGCFHGSPVFWQFPWRRKYYKGGILLIWAILCWHRCQLAFVSRFFINVALICFVTLYLLALSPLTLGVFVKCLAMHSGGFRFPLKRGFFLTGSMRRHVIVICTSVSLISHMYLSVLINSNGVSLLAECWAKRCSPFSSAAFYPVQQSVPLFNKWQVVFYLLSIRGNRGNVWGVLPTSSDVQNINLRDYFFCVTVTSNCMRRVIHQFWWTKHYCGWLFLLCYIKLY